MSYVLEIILLGLGNLALHKLRSVLTSLGIILGVAAVIVVVSIGEGNKRTALQDIEALGATNIIVRSTKPSYSESTSQKRTLYIHYGLKRVDLLRLKSAFDEELPVVELKAVGSEVRFGPERIISQSFGTVPEFLELANLSVEPRGRYLLQSDLDQKAEVAVIGHTIAETFFKFDDPIGSQIRIDMV
ncbi:MAG: ABC transporter permease, partial [Planctomycetota bacterium]|nr:ABC transporter permease [Planctomycetota bacterium]